MCHACVIKTGSKCQALILNARIMNTYHLRLVACVFLITQNLLCRAHSADEDNNDGSKYARARIAINGEVEWRRSISHPEKLHVPQLPGSYDFGCLVNMKECVRSYVEDENLSGIRGAFLMAYVAASIPHGGSADIMDEYGDILFKLQERLGDAQFTACLLKMRPEVQSSVFYILANGAWPCLDEDMIKKFQKKWPRTNKLYQHVRHLKWPTDYEKNY
jgi:hypothetical protein